MNSVPKIIEGNTGGKIPCYRVRIIRDKPRGLSEMNSEENLMKHKRQNKIIIWIIKSCDHKIM